MKHFQNIPNCGQQRWRVVCNAWGQEGRLPGPSPGTGLDKSTEGLMWSRELCCTISHNCIAGQLAIGDAHILPGSWKLSRQPPMPALIVIGPVGPLLK